MTSELPASATPGPTVPRDALGRALRDLRISIMDRCNFRCPYCMPHARFHANYRFLRGSERLSFDEIARLTRLFAALGVAKVRLTGGEPLLRPDVAEIVGELSAIAGVEDVSLTTNGVQLAQRAAALKASGLRRVTVSLDSLDPQVSRRIRGEFDERDRVLDGIRAATSLPCVHPGAALLRRRALHLPLRQPGTGLARSAARRCERQRTAQPGPRGVTAPREPLQRTARHTPRGTAPQDRDVLYRWLNRS